MENKFLKNFNVQFIFLHILFISFSIFRNIVNYKLKGKVLERFFYNIIHIDFGLLYFISLSTLIWNICLAIKNRYEDINEILKKNIRVTLPNCDHSLQNIKRVKYLFDTNNEIVSIFNEVFGLQLLIIFFRTVASIIMTLDNFILNPFENMDAQQIVTSIYLIFVIVSIFIDIFTDIFFSIH